MAEVSRRLKAARWLAGGIDDQGKVQALSTVELAQRPSLVRNRITANRLSEFERLVTEARDMELRVIAEAMDLPEGWFELERSPTESRLTRVEAILARLAEHFDITVEGEEDALAEEIEQAVDEAAGSSASEAPAARRSARGGRRDASGS